MKYEDLNVPAVDSAIRALRPGAERWDYNHGAREFHHLGRHSGKSGSYL